MRVRIVSARLYQSVSTNFSPMVLQITCLGNVRHLRQTRYPSQMKRSTCEDPERGAQSRSVSQEAVHWRPARPQLAHFPLDRRPRRASY